jgi:hypothetical protein
VGITRKPSKDFEGLGRCDSDGCAGLGIVSGWVVFPLSSLDSHSNSIFSFMNSISDDVTTRLRGQSSQC